MGNETFTPIRPRWGRRLVISGIVIATVALVVGGTCGVMVWMSVAGPFSEAMTTPSRPTPVDARLSLKAGGYTVSELVGHQSSHGPVTRTETAGATVTPDMIEVTGADGATITVSAFPSGQTQSLHRDRDIYEGVARFVVTEPGQYHVLIHSPAGRQVVIAPSIGSGLGAVLGWLLTGIASFAVLALGVILLIIGLVLPRRPTIRPGDVAGRWGPYVQSPGGTGMPGHGSGPPAGWYPAPDVPHRQRYWDGRGWTGQLR